MTHDKRIYRNKQFEHRPYSNISNNAFGTF